MSAHTPGPWFMTSPRTVCATINGRSTTVHSHVGLSGSLLLRETVHNARLIAAAPDLLDALKALADDHEHGAPGTMRQDHLLAARAAIAKAEGESE